MRQRFTFWDFVLVLVAGTVLSVMVLLAVVAGTGSEEVGVGLQFLVVIPSQYVGSLAALAWVRGRRGYAGLADAYGLQAGPGHMRYLMAGAGLNVGLTLVLVPVVQALDLEQSPQQVVEIVGELEGPLVIAGAALVTAVLVPLVEELTYRGLLLRLLLQRQGTSAAVVVSSLVFAAVHLAGLQSYDRESIVAALAVAVPEFFVIGVVLARLTIKHGSLGPAIFTHSGFNLLSFVLLVAAPTLLE